MAGKHVKREVIDFGDNRDVPSGPFALLDLFDGNTNVQVGFGVYDGRIMVGSKVVYRSASRSECIKWIEDKLQREVFR